MSDEGIIRSEDIEAYSYSIEVTLATIINFISIVVIAIIFGRFVEMIVFAIGFVPLRMLKGGYHASTHIGCVLMQLHLLMHRLQSSIRVLLWMPTAMNLSSVST